MRSPSMRDIKLHRRKHPAQRLVVGRQPAPARVELSWPAASPSPNRRVLIVIDSFAHDPVRTVMLAIFNNNFDPPHPSSAWAILLAVRPPETLPRFPTRSPICAVPCWGITAKPFQLRTGPTHGHE